MARRFEIKRILFPILIVIILASAFFPLSTLSSSGDAPKPVKGILDLSGWDFSNGRPSLTGDWEFYWNELYTYSDFQDLNADVEQEVYVPKTWNSYEQNGTDLPDFGYATYRLKV